MNLNETIDRVIEKHQSGFSDYVGLMGDALYLVQALVELQGSIDRSGFDISQCNNCGKPVICIPDGLPGCEECYQ